MRVPAAVAAVFTLAIGIVAFSSARATASPVPYISGNISAGPSQILAVDFAPGVDVTVQVDFDPPSGFDVVDTKPAVAGATVFDLGGNGLLHPGAYVVASDGTTTKDLVLADVHVDSVDPAANTVGGTAPDGAVTVDPSPFDAPQTGTASGGHFDLGFSNIVPGQTGTVYVNDGEGDRTLNDWQAPSSQLVVNRPNGVEGWNFEPGGTADIQVFDHFNDVNPLVHESEPIGSDGRFMHNGFNGNFTIEPGMWVVVTDGTNAKDVVASEMEVWGTNAALGTVFGHAAPGSTLTVKTVDQVNDCWRNVTADASTGDWTVDFAVDDPATPGPDCTLPVPFDAPLTSQGQPAGTHGDAFQTDADGDWSAHAQWNPSRITVSAMSSMVAAMSNSFRGGADVAITIDDPNTGTNPDVTASATAQAYAYSQFNLCTFPGAVVGQYGCTAVGGPIDIQPGFTVTADDGFTHKSEVVTAVSVTSVLMNPSRVTGTADPFSHVLVSVHMTGNQRFVQADGQGHWTADFSVAQGSNAPEQFSVNTTGDVLQLELTGQIDGDETNYYFNAAPRLDVFPSMGLVDGQPVGLSGANWVPNKNMTVVECARQAGGPNPNVCDNPATAQHLVTNGDGTVFGQFQVRRVITVNGAPYACDLAPEGCGLSAILWDGAENGSNVIAVHGPDDNPISFGPYVEVSPNTGLADGQIVTVTGAHWLPNQTLIIGECARGHGGPSFNVCDGAVRVQLMTGPDGTISGTYEVHRTITVDVGHGFQPYNCVIEPNGCGLGVVQWHGAEGDLNAGITLIAPDNNPLFFAPYIDVVPSDALREGQMVGITGAGWPGNKEMDVTECALGFPLGYDSCDGTTQQHWTTNFDGTVSAQFRVSRSIYTHDTGVRDCASGPGLCGLVAVVWQGAVGDVGAGFTIDFPERNPLNFLATPSDPFAPTITIKAPADGVRLAEHKVLKAGYSCTDKGGSGLANCIGDVANGSPIDTTAIGGHMFTVSARDRVGNLTVLTRHYVVMDATAPMIVLTTPTNGATFNKDAFVPANYSCSDTGSGISTCLGTAQNGGPINTSSLGKKTFVVTAIDNAGNVTKVTATYTVVYGWNGFAYLGPPPALNPAGSAGQPLTVGFYLSGNQGLPVTSSVKTVQVDCTYGFGIGKSEAAAGTVAWDGANGNYVFLWKTKAAWAHSCRQLAVTLMDGTVHEVNFRFN